MTDKVFTENKREKYDNELTLQLQEVFGHEIIFLPWHKTQYECYGHADGYIKYAGGKRILMNNHRDSAPEEANEIKRRLENKGFEVSELHFSVENPNIDYNWAYINFLHIGHHIIVPTFGIEEDSQAIAQIQATFPYCEIHTIESYDIAKDGGALHCITWNIKSN